MVDIWLTIWVVSLVRFLGDLVNLKKNIILPKKVVKITIDILSLLGIVFLITSNVTGGDIINYENSYNYKFDDSLRERIFYLLRVIAYQNNINFFTFRAILQLFAGLILYEIFRRYKISFAGFLVYYMPILIFMDSMQFRNSICIWILSIAITLLIENRQFNRLLFVFVILFISQIHTAFIFYILLLFYPFFIKNKRFERMLYAFVVILSTIVLFNGNKIPFIDLLFKYFLDNDDARKTIYSTTARWGFLVPTIIQIVLLSVMIVAYKSLKQNEHNIIAYKNADYFHVVLFLNKITLLFVPFMMTNITYYRFVRNGYFLAIIALVGVLGSMSKRSTRIYILSGLLIVTILWVIFEVVIYDKPEVIILPILKEGMSIFVSNKYF